MGSPQVILDHRPSNLLPIFCTRYSYSLIDFLHGDHLVADDKKKVRKKDEETVIGKMELQTDGNIIFREDMEEGEEVGEEEVYVDEEGNVHRIHTEY